MVRCPRRVGACFRSFGIHAHDRQRVPGRHCRQPRQRHTHWRAMHTQRPGGQGHNEPGDDRVPTPDRLLGSQQQHTCIQFAKSGGADAVIYNAKADRFFAARSGYHRGPVMGMFDGSGNFITDVPTTSVSHEVGFDQTNDVVYTEGGGLIWFQIPR